MAYTLSRVDRVPRKYAVTAVDEDGAPVVLTSVDFAVIPPRAAVTQSTAWATVPVIDGAATVMLAGYEATPDGALIIPAGGADLHRRWTEGDFVDTEPVERISVE